MPSLSTIRSDDSAALRPVVVYVIASNHERRIDQCLSSLEVATKLSPQFGALQVRILVHDSRDQTYERAQAWCNRLSGWRVMRLAHADRSLLWNMIVHDLSTPARWHLVVDANAQFDRQALRQLHQLSQHPDEPRLACIRPGAGRWPSVSAPPLAMALSGNLVATLKQRRIRLPHGVLDLHGLLIAIAKFDAAPVRNDYRDHHVVWLQGQIVNTRHHTGSGPLQLLRAVAYRYQHAFGYWQLQSLRHQILNFGFESLPAQLPPLAWRDVLQTGSRRSIQPDAMAIPAQLTHTSMSAGSN